MAVMLLKRLNFAVFLSFFLLLVLFSCTTNPMDPGTRVVTNTVTNLIYTTTTSSLTNVVILDNGQTVTNILPVDANSTYSGNFLPEASAILKRMPNSVNYLVAFNLPAVLNSAAYTRVYQKILSNISGSSRGSFLDFQASNGFSLANGAGFRHAMVAGFTSIETKSYWESDYSYSYSSGWYRYEGTPDFDNPAPYHSLWSDFSYLSSSYVNGNWVYTYSGGLAYTNRYRQYKFSWIYNYPDGKTSTNNYRQVERTYKTPGSTFFGIVKGSFAPNQVENALPAEYKVSPYLTSTARFFRQNGSTSSLHFGFNPAGDTLYLAGKEAEATTLVQTTEQSSIYGNNVLLSTLVQVNQASIYGAIRVDAGFLADWPLYLSSLSADVRADIERHEFIYVFGIGFSQNLNVYSRLIVREKANPANRIAEVTVASYLGVDAIMNIVDKYVTNTAP